MLQGADLDKSGMVTKEELAIVIKDQLHIQLTDPINDLDIIFDSLDEDKSGVVSMEEFCRLFEPTIVRRASSSGTTYMLHANFGSVSLSVKSTSVNFVPVLFACHLISLYLLYILAHYVILRACAL